MLSGAIVLLIVITKVMLRWAWRLTPAIQVRTTVDFMHVCVVFPFVSLALLPFAIKLAPHLQSTWLSEFITMLKSANVGSIALAGGVGLFFVLSQITNMD